LFSRRVRVIDNARLLGREAGYNQTLLLVARPAHIQVDVDMRLEEALQVER
jgi:hypothetical protein